MTVNFPRNAEDAELLVTNQVMEPLDTRGGLYRGGLKRVFESALILAAAPIVLPLVLVLAALIACDGSSPFFRQKRVGKDGRTFLMWKLRTMVPNAEALLEAHLNNNPSARSEWDSTQKLKQDPRITRIGALLRKSSMDELPQLWNVLMGDMALVGPRPMLCNQKSLYPGVAYYAMRPGITGFWQISDRNDSEFKSRAIYDNRYYRAMSFMTDAGILYRTFGAVFRGTGY